MPSTTQERAQRELQKLVGLRLTATSRAADMRGFHFGVLRPFRDRTVGEFALHVQCAWRIEGPDGVLTGRSDLRQPAEEMVGPDLEHWDYERDGNLQDHHIAEWLGQLDHRAGSRPEAKDSAVVLAASATSHCGAEIDLLGGYRLVLFPAGSVGEDWRLFRPADDAPHFVVAGGRIEDPG